MGDRMGKKNHCVVILYHKCGASNRSNCKFFQKLEGDCRFIDADQKYCTSEKAQKDAWERKQAADYSNQKLTA